MFFFTSMPQGTNWSPRFAVFGDMGNTNAQSLTRLQEDTMNGMYDAILHVGDFAYNMDDVKLQIFLLIVGIVKFDILSIRILSTHF